MGVGFIANISSLRVNFWQNLYVQCTLNWRHKIYIYLLNFPTFYQNASNNPNIKNFQEKEGIPAEEQILTFEQVRSQVKSVMYVVKTIKIIK